MGALDVIKAKREGEEEGNCEIMESAGALVADIGEDEGRGEGGVEGSFDVIKASKEGADDGKVSICESDGALDVARVDGGKVEGNGDGSADSVVADG